MIHYVCTQRHSYTMGIFLAHYAGAIGKQVRLLDYPSFFRLDRLQGGVVILTDFDRLSPEDLARAGRYREFLTRPGSPVAVFNDPGGTLQRFDLLRRLHDSGMNSFNVYRTGEARSAIRFPVFIRHERGHGRILSGLLDDEAALAARLKEIAADPETKEATDLMIVEFANKPFADGYYRKYGAFRVGETIYPQHCFIRKAWMIRGLPPLSEITAEGFAEHERFLHENPHADQLRKVFDFAGVDYGRIDYSVVDGKVEVFEINTNPTVMNTRPDPASPIDMKVYSQRHEAAMEALLALGDPSRFADIPESLRLPGPVERDVAKAHARVMRKMSLDRTMFEKRSWLRGATARLRRRLFGRRRAA
jgi:hypothetical protein